MTLVVWLLPSDMGFSRHPLALDGGLLFLLLVLGVATEFNRVQYKRGDHNDNRNDFEVRHDLTSFAFVFGAAAQIRDLTAAVFAKAKTRKSIVSDLSASEVKSQAPSVSFLPEARGLRFLLYHSKFPVSTYVKTAGRLPGGLQWLRRYSSGTFVRANWQRSRSQNFCSATDSRMVRISANRSRLTSPFSPPA